MGLLDFFKKKDKAQPKKLNIEIVEEEKITEREEFYNNEYKAIQEERQRRLEEEEAKQRDLQEANRAFLEANGVNVELFDSRKVLDDALRTIEIVCPCMLRFDRGLSHEEPSIYFASPTKTGKVPKNVVDARLWHDDPYMRTDRFGFESYECGDSLSVAISYLADGRINKFDIRGRHKNSTVEVSIRRKGDALYIANAGAIGPTGEWQSLCPVVDASPEAILSALNEEVQRLY